MKSLQPKESEKDTERYLSKCMIGLGGLSYKWSSPGNSGVPDRICIFPTGQVVFVELKSEGKKPTELQEFVHRNLRDKRCIVRVLTTKLEVDTFIDYYKEMQP